MSRVVRWSLVVVTVLAAPLVSLADPPAEPVAPEPIPTEPTAPPAAPGPSAPEQAPPVVAPAPPAPAPVAAPEPAPVVVVAQPAPPVAAPAPVPLVGLNVPISLTPDGVTQVDGRVFTNHSGTHNMVVRRLRALLTGASGDYFRFYTQLDFASSKLVVENAYIEIGVPELSVRFGKDKVEFGLERIQNDTDLTFLERSFPTEISPDRDVGVAARGDLFAGVLHYWAAVVDGAPDDTTALETTTGKSLEYDAHILISPFKAAGLSRFGDLAVGAAATAGDTYGTLTTPGLTAITTDGLQTIVTYASNTTTNNINTTAIVYGYRTRQTVHGYYYVGPLGVLAEYVRDREPIEFRDVTTGVVDRAWQVAASVALTPGDHPSFHAINPVHPFDPKHGYWGAVELAARYGELIINEDAFAAKVVSATTAVERARDVTVGANWYFNRFFKLQLDFSDTHFEDGAVVGDRIPEHVIAVRAQAQF